MFVFDGLLQTPEGWVTSERDGSRTFRRVGGTRYQLFIWTVGDPIGVASWNPVATSGGHRAERVKVRPSRFGRDPSSELDPIGSAYSDARTEPNIFWTRSRLSSEA